MQAGLIAIDVMGLDLILLPSELMITSGIKERRQLRSINLHGVKKSAKSTVTAMMSMQNTCQGKNT